MLAVPALVWFLWDTFSGVSERKAWGEAHLKDFSDRYCCLGKQSLSLWNAPSTMPNKLKPNRQ